LWQRFIILNILIGTLHVRMEVEGFGEGEEPWKKYCSFFHYKPPRLLTTEKHQEVKMLMEM